VGGRVTDITDLHGWDEFSAYSWLNSAKGKMTIGWPLDKPVPLNVVRAYIDGDMPSEPVTYDPPTDKDEPVPETGQDVSPIRHAVYELLDVLSSKNKDYSSGGDFWNFEFAAEFAGDLTTHDVIMSQLGIKVGRIKTLLEREDMPENEPLLDSFKDLAGYAIILYAYWKDALDG